MGGKSVDIPGQGPCAQSLSRCGIRGKPFERQRSSQHGCTPATWEDSWIIPSAEDDNYFYRVESDCIPTSLPITTRNNPELGINEGILDRILEHGRIVTLEGPSMRTRHLDQPRRTSLDYQLDFRM